MIIYARGYAGKTIRVILIYKYLYTPSIIRKLLYLIIINLGTTIIIKVHNRRSLVYSTIVFNIKLNKERYRSNIYILYYSTLRIKQIGIIYLYHRTS